MAIVTVTELREYMSQVSLNQAQLRSAQIVLDGTQQALERHLNRPVQLMQVRERVTSDWNGDIYLSVTPVHKVISLRAAESGASVTLTVDSTPLAPQEVSRLWDAMPEQLEIFPGGVRTGKADIDLDVQYIGGYNGYVDYDLKLKIMEVASRTITFNQDDTLSLKGSSAREPAGTPTFRDRGWRDDELKQLDRLRRRTAVR